MQPSQLWGAQAPGTSQLFPRSQGDGSSTGANGQGREQPLDRAGAALSSCVFPIPQPRLCLSGCADQGDSEHPTVASGQVRRWPSWQQCHFPRGEAINSVCSAALWGELSPGLSPVGAELTGDHPILRLSSLGGSAHPGGGFSLEMSPSWSKPCLEVSPAWGLISKCGLIPGKTVLIPFSDLISDQWLIPAWMLSPAELNRGAEPRLGAKCSPAQPGC